MFIIYVNEIYQEEGEIYQEEVDDEEAKTTFYTDHVVLLCFNLYIIFIEYFCRLCLL